MAMLRITRLHLLLAGLGVICLLGGAIKMFLDYRGTHPETTSTPSAEVPPARATPSESIISSKELALNIAIVGEAYRPLLLQFGDIPAISEPLRSAKRLQNENNAAEALRASETAWQALKEFRQKAVQEPGTYVVTRGDTLWTIAASHSPVRAGAGWVTIWKANKRFINNFDRLEVGWMLKIPPKPAQYAMPFWSPPSINH